MSTRHPPGCACDQPWHHRRPAAEVHAARRGERERMNTAREIGKTLHQLSRERRCENDTPGAPPTGGSARAG